MFFGRLKSKLFSTTLRNYDQLKIKNFTAKLKQYCSSNPFKFCCSTVNALSYVLRANGSTFFRPFKFTSSSSKFYHQYYCNFSTKKLITIVFKRFQPGRPLCTFAAAAYSFSWEDNQITNVEIQTHVDELTLLEKQTNGNPHLPSYSEYKNLPDQWQNILDEPNIKIWQLPYEKTGFMQYKVFGRFSDVTARQFFTVQTDLEYRRKWDELVIDIDVVDENETTNEQVLRWISYFPYPFNAREYVYIRKAKILEEQNVLVLMSRSVNHPQCVTSRKHVRVPLYISEMVIKPHKHIDEPGLDYLLTYCDNPQTSFPTRLASWVVTKAIPDYINKLHEAAKKIYENSDTNILTLSPPIGKSGSGYEFHRQSFSSCTGNAVEAC